MSTIEERIVSMKFQGEQFLAGIDKSLGKLEQFNNKLKSTEGAKALDGVGSAAQRQSGALSKMAEGVQAISDRFKTMSVVGIAAISSVVNQAVIAGTQLAKSLTLDPLTQGFKEYETNINSIQTILSNTQAAGTTLKDVTGALDELNHYSDQTIYNFSEMAKNIGTFTAAGVGLKPATQAIKGIANLAALSGSNSEQASTAMYQLSQAISSGKVSLEDWNSVVNAGMGGTVFKRALAQNAVAMGTLSKGAVKLEGDMKNVTIKGKSFRESITAKPGEESWLTSDVLTQTLAQFTGDLTDAQLAAEGFDASQIKAIQAQAKMARNAATEVKTMSQLMNTLKESAGSGWAQTWKTIFGDFPEAKKLFTNLNNIFGGMITRSADARNKMLKDWAKLGGRKDLFEGITNAFKFMQKVFKPINQAFRDIFPKTTAKDLAAMSKSFLEFTKNLSISGTTANNIRRTFAGFFAIFGIGWDILKEVVRTLFSLIGVATDGSGGFLAFTASVGDFLVHLREAINKGEGLKNLFKGIADVLALPIKALKIVGKALADVFKDVDTKVVTDAIGNAAEKLKPLGDLGGTFASGWGKFIGVLDSIMTKLREVGTWITEKFGGIGTKIAAFFSGLDFGDVTAGLNTGIFAALVLMLRKLIGGGGAGGIIDNLSDAFEKLTGVLGSMQNALRAATLLAIAAAVLILAIAMEKLSKIDAAGLTRAGVAIAVLFAQLMTSMLIFEKMSGFKGFAKMPFIALSMVLLAVAVNILATAATKLASLSWEDLGKGLAGVAVLLAAIVGAINLMPNSGKLILSAAGVLIMSFAIGKLAQSVTGLAKLSWEEMARGLTGVGVLLAALMIFAQKTSFNVKGLVSGIVISLLAAAIKTLADAIKDLSKLSWDEMSRGLTAMGAGLGIISGALKLLPASTFLGAASIFIVAMALGMIGDALAGMGGMSWETIAKGLVTLAASLAIIAGALYLMSGALPGAAALIVAAAALSILADALFKMAGMSWEEIAKGLVALAGSLLILAGGLYLMSAALPGAAALIVAAAALAIIAPVLTTLGAMSWGAIAAGLVALAGVFAVLGIAALVLTPVIPSLFSLALSLLAIGAAMLVAGAGVALFGIGIAALAAGLAALAVSGIAGTTALVGMLGVLLGAVPAIVKIIGALLLALLQLIIDVAPKLLEAAVVLIEVIVKALVRVSPKIVNGLLKILTELLKALANYVPKMVDAGYKLIIGILNGIAKNVNGMVTAATNIVVAFLNAIGQNAPRIADAGAKMIINFVNSMANSIRSNAEAMRSAGLNLATAIIDGMTGGLASGIGRLVDAAKNVAGSALDAAKSVLGINSPSKEFYKVGKYVMDGFRKGLDGNKGQINTAFKSLRDQLNAAYKSAGEDIETLQKKLKRLNSARKKDRAEIRETTRELAQARLERTRTYSTLTFINKYYKDEQILLGKLAGKYDVLTTKIKTAQETYNNAIKTRDDYKKSITDQFSDMASPTGETTVAGFITDLKKQLEDTKSLSNTLQQLRAIGLNDELYKDLLATGTSALPFVKELLAGGKTSIDQINALDKELDSVAGSLGRTASLELYQAAVDSAAGLVKGLQNQQAAIEKQMDKIADTMVRSIKKKLGIKSPSRVFAEVGKFSAEGLSKGLETSSDIVADSASSVGNKAVEALRVSLSNVDKMVMGNIDVNPVIRPVLDLTDIQNKAGKLGSLLPSGTKMSVEGSYSAAVSTSASVSDRFDGDDFDGAAGSGVNLTYTQNNYSPKAISPVETYRNTKNQLSTVKGALAT